MQENKNSSQPAIAGTLAIDDAIELVRRLCVANANFRMYSPTHPMALNGVKTAHEFMVKLIAKSGNSIVVSMSADKILIGQLAVETRNPLVAQFVARLMTLHLNNLEFKADLTTDELAHFYRVLNMKDADVAAEGGVKALFDKGGIKNIALTNIAFVMISENERVVSADSRVVSATATVVEGGGSARPASSGQEDMVRYMVSEMMKGKGDKDWLLKMVKNDPKNAAQIISQGIEKAVAEGHELVDGDELVKAFMINVKYVAQTLASESSAADSSPGAKSMRDAILALEAEIRTRMSGMGSTEKSARFLNELLEMVASYAGNARADRISGEFVQDQMTLKKAEILLKDLAGSDQSTEEILNRLRKQMIAGGIGESDVDTFIKEQSKKPRPKRKKAFDQALQDGLTRSLGKIDMGEGEGREERLRDLTTFVGRKIEEKEKEFRGEVGKLKKAVDRRETAIDRLVSGGVILWDADGCIEYVSRPAATVIRVKKGAVLNSNLLNFFRNSGREGGAEALQSLDKTGLANWELTLLTELKSVMFDEVGLPIGAVLSEDSATHPDAAIPLPPLVPEDSP